MTTFIALTSIMGALLLGAISPGPSFIVVAKTAIAGSRRNGIATALGLGVASALFGACALMGLHILLEQVSWAYLTFKICGGAYLLFIGYKMWCGSNTPLEVNYNNLETSPRALTCFIHGIITQLSNPKTALVFASVFATFLKADISFTLSALLVGLIFLMEFFWYSLVVIAFSSPKPQGLYLASKKWIDRTASLAIGTLGLKLIFQAYED
jgi:threonine/homoserine/homoserine lactone efflux protein